MEHPPSEPESASNWLNWDPENKQYRADLVEVDREIQESRQAELDQVKNVKERRDSLLDQVKMAGSLDELSRLSKRFETLVSEAEDRAETMVSAQTRMNAAIDRAISMFGNAVSLAQNRIAASRPKPEPGGSRSGFAPDPPRDTARKAEQRRRNSEEIAAIYEGVHRRVRQSQDYSHKLAMLNISGFQFSPCPNPNCTQLKPIGHLYCRFCDPRRTIL